MKHPTVKLRQGECFCGRPEWHYTITGFPPPHQRTTQSSGPFRTRRAAEADANRTVREFMSTWNKAKASGNPNCT